MAEGEELWYSIYKARDEKMVAKDGIHTLRIASFLNPLAQVSAKLLRFLTFHCCLKFLREQPEMAIRCSVERLEHAPETMMACSSVESVAGVGFHRFPLPQARNPYDWSSHFGCNCVPSLAGKK
ncbi:hypothetical protein OIU84_024211 [Salix udensis]|uniref:Uncharacterized protein n=1 Tax=Salix udensis TaxID=889485 RepID=A0AAD6KGV7_9ROSI|nr:hypothetical protein OIU84_024211 [Salix udensis]